MMMLTNTSVEITASVLEGTPLRKAGLVKAIAPRLTGREQ